jgi:uncharacterized membrane protein
MIWLLLGVVLWSATHLSKSLAVSLRQSLTSRLGEDRYKGLFSVLIIASLVLIVLGWRSTTPSTIYLPALWGRHVSMLLMLMAVVLFAASGMGSNINRVLRHPQLTGVITWSIAHLLANGDSRSLVLFGGIGVWALLEIVFINRRDGAWKKPTPKPLSADVRVAAGGIIGYVIIYLVHPYLFGVSPM